MKKTKLIWEKVKNTGGAKESIKAVSGGFEVHVDKLDTGYRLFVRVHRKGVRWNCLDSGIKTLEAAKKDGEIWLGSKWCSVAVRCSLNPS